MKKQKWYKNKGGRIGGIMGGIIGVILLLNFNITWISFLLFLLIGFFSGVIFSSKVNSKSIIIGGWIGFLIPWAYFAYITIACVGSSCGHLGMGVPFIFIYSIIACVIGVVIALILNKITKIGGLGYLYTKTKKTRR